MTLNEIYNKSVTHIEIYYAFKTGIYENFFTFIRNPLPYITMDTNTRIDYEKDKKKQELIEVRNLADTMVYTTEKMMKEVEEKKVAITDDEKKAVEDELKAVKEVKDKDDAEAIKKSSEALSKAAQAVGMKMYQQEQAKGPAAGAPAEGTDGQNSETKKDEQEPIEGEVVK